MYMHTIAMSSCMMQLDLTAELLAQSTVCSGTDALMLQRMKQCHISQEDESGTQRPSVRELILSISFPVCYRAYYITLHFQKCGQIKTQ